MRHFIMTGHHVMGFPCCLSHHLPLQGQPCLFASAQAALAGPPAWQEYSKLFLESRFVHVTSADFAALCLFAPFWMWNDAEKRRWEDRWEAGLAHSLLCHRLT
jgi:hypothetical protein